MVVFTWLAHYIRLLHTIWHSFWLYLLVEKKNVQSHLFALPLSVCFLCVWTNHEKWKHALECACARVCVCHSVHVIRFYYGLLACLCVCVIFHFAASIPTISFACTRSKIVFNFMFGLIFSIFSVEFPFRFCRIPLDHHIKSMKSTENSKLATTTQWWKMQFIWLCNVFNLSIRGLVPKNQNDSITKRFISSFSGYKKVIIFRTTTTTTTIEIVCSLCYLCAINTEYKQKTTTNRMEMIL